MRCSMYLLFAVQVCAVAAVPFYCVKNKLLTTSEVASVKCQIKPFSCMCMHVHTFNRDLLEDLDCVLQVFFQGLTR